MDNSVCPNFKVCRLVTTETVVPDEKQRKSYMNDYCRAGRAAWGNCKRYISKNELGFCPDFVLPETDLTLREIIDKFDELNY